MCRMNAGIRVSISAGCHSCEDAMGSLENTSVEVQRVRLPVLCREWAVYNSGQRLAVLVSVAGSGVEMRLQTKKHESKPCS